VGGVLIALVVTWLGQGHSRALSPAIFRVLVIGSVVPAVLGVLGLAALARETPVPVQSRPMPVFRLSHFDLRYRVFLGIMVLFTLGNSSDAFLVLRAHRSGLSIPGVLGMVVSYNLVYSLLSGPAGALSDRIGRRRLLVGGWLVYAIIYVGFAAITAGWQAWALMTVYGVYAACTEGVARAFVADLVPPAQRGTAYGVFHTAIGVAALPASLIAGVLWEGVGPWPGWGPRAAFAFGAAMALTASTLLATALPPGPDRHDRRAA
jgi:MFS family permease